MRGSIWGLLVLTALLTDEAGVPLTCGTAFESCERPDEEVRALSRSKSEGAQDE